MRKIIVVLAPVALALGLVFFGSYAGDTDDMGKAQAQTLTARPNIVFILTDDMLKDDMMYMPKTHSLLREQGMGFRNAFVSNAICCPSRATIMRGPYSYEEDIHVPLVVRGPGVAAGSTTYKLVLNTDYLPTFTNLAGEQIPHYVDGRSLKPVLDGSVTSWRSSILLEAAANYSQAFRGIRTVSTNTITRRKYVEYSGGAREHYTMNLPTPTTPLRRPRAWPCVCKRKRFAPQTLAARPRTGCSSLTRMSPHPHGALAEEGIP